jgi:tetratricopeptide (TPR) repeat protein
VFVKKFIINGIIGRQLEVTFAMMVLALICLNDCFAQKSQTVTTRQSSIEAFSKGNYEQAYNDFSQLLLKYPKDPLYKYYSGACLVMMKKDPQEAVALLQQSLNGASVVKSLPPDALFYLGRAQQMSGKFTEAIASYNSFTDQVGKKAAREQGVPGYIQECENKKGIVAASAVIPAAAPSGEKAAVIKPADQPAVNNAGEKQDGKEISERKELPSDYENMLDEALKLQYKADSLTLIAGEQKKQLDKLSEPEAVSLKMKISQNEILASSYQKSADMKYADAQAKMNPKHETVAQTAETIPQVVSKEPVLAEEGRNIQGSAGQTDTMKKEIPAALKSAGVFSFFEVLPRGAAYPDEKIKIDPEVPEGLIYRIQLAVFRNPVAPSFFKGITPVYGFKVSGSDKTNYYAGMFRRSADAKKALLQVKETGFKDAFIVALSGNKPVSADRAAVLENEWGTKSFVDMTLPGATPDTIPPTLAFRVEVVRSLKPLKPDAVDALRGMAGNRGLDILHLTDGNNVYLIGKFITFESAAEYADLLIRNNYRSAKVVSWLGNKEVPVETARQLFNDLK